MSKTVNRGERRALRAARAAEGMPVSACAASGPPNRMFSHREIFFPIGDFGPGLPAPLKKSQPESAKGRRGAKAMRLQRKSRTPTMRPALTYFLKLIFFMKIIRWRRA